MFPVICNILQRVTFLACLILAVPSFAKTIQAKSDVQVLSAPKKKAPVILSIKKGDTLKATNRLGMYWKVKAGGKEGFVSILKVKLKKSDTNIEDMITREIQQSRDEGDLSQVRGRSTIMGVRGLDETTEIESAGNVKPQLRLVYDMENYTLSKSKISELEELVTKEITKRTKKKSN